MVVHAFEVLERVVHDEEGEEEGAEERARDGGGAQPTAEVRAVAQERRPQHEGGVEHGLQEAEVEDGGDGGGDEGPAAEARQEAVEVEDAHVEHACSHAPRRSLTCRW